MMQPIKKKGIVFEQAIAEIQGMMEPGATVTHDEQIIDWIGQSRQFDVVVRGKYGGFDILGVIECKDWKAKIDVQVVDAFITKSQGVRANFTVIASNSGFSKNALEKCKQYNIAAISLLSREKYETPFLISAPMYAQTYHFESFVFAAKFVGDSYLPDNITIIDVYLGEQSLFEWFLYHLSKLDETADFLYSDNLIYTKIITFNSPQIIHGYGISANVLELRFIAHAKVVNKVKNVGISGEAIFDWNKESFTIPPKGTLKTEFIKLDVDQWDTFEGEIVASPPFNMVFKALKKFIINEPVIDLEKL